MKRKQNVSPYSTMYLVTPAIYEKLLLCIDEGDKKLLDSLNKPHNVSEDRRPAQVVIDALSSQEIKPIGMKIEPEVTGIHKIDPDEPMPEPEPKPEPIVKVEDVKDIKPAPAIIPQMTQNIPIAVPIIDQKPIPVPVMPQVNNPPSMPIITPIQTQQPIVPNPQVVVPHPGLQSVKPVSIKVPTDYTQPAVFVEPIRPPAIREAIEVPELPDDYDDWSDMDYEDKGIKRPIDETFEDPDSKRLRPTDEFHDRDNDYKQKMLDRIRNKRRRYDSLHNPLTTLPRDLVQWQPVQCVNNTTGGKICNQDSQLQPSIVQSDASRPKISVRKDIFIRPNACPICNVRMGNSDLLQMHMRLRHGQKNKSQSGLNIPGLSRDEKKPKSNNRRPRFQTPGRVSPAVPLTYDPSQDVSFRTQKNTNKRKRFTSAGNEDEAEPFVYDPSQDVSFRKKSKKKETLTKTKPTRKAKPSLYRCHICKDTVSNITALKDHYALKHKLNPEDVFRELAAEAITNPQPGSSRDFYDWGSLRIQPQRRANTRRQRFGQLKKTDFSNWK